MVATLQVDTQEAQEGLAVAVLEALQPVKMVLLVAQTQVVAVVEMQAVAEVQAAQAAPALSS